MAFFIHSDPLLQFVVWLSLALLGLVLLLLLQIVLLRINLIARTLHERHFLEVWRPLLVATVAGEAVAIPRLPKSDEINFLKLWNHLQESLRGESKERLNAVAIHCGMLERSRSMLQKKDLRLQLLALNTLGHLIDSLAWDEMLQLARRPDPLLSLAAARALFQINAVTALIDLKGELLEREDWPTAQLAILLQETCTDNTFDMLANTASQFANSADPSDLARLKRLLQLLEIAPYQQVIAAIRIILSISTDDDVVAQCLKFLRKPNDLLFVRPHLTHPNWVVRLQAARALGRLGSKEDLPQLAALLSDPVWWVRYRTAQAILELMHGDSMMMSALRAQLSDRYARDMLEMVIAEKVRR